MALSPKPLPAPAKDDKLPSLPPLDFDDFSSPSAPSPPPKIIQDLAAEQSPPASHKPSPIDVKASLAASETSLGSAPLTPSIIPDASHPPLSPSLEGKSKKANPLTDLIDTEKAYVEQLTGIIRKVAAAWSRSNLPPPELDTMFRSIESIYKANRSLLAKLKEIGTNPKGLGDLLMRWIDELEAPYTNYSMKFCTGFDVWEPVQANSRVRTILAMFSTSNPPPLPTSTSVHPSEPPIWSLDELFLLPKGRLKYYKKLYGRLLKSTSPGRSDHRMLTGALEKLEKLLATIDSRAEIRVGDTLPSKQEAPLTIETEDEVVIDMRTRQSTLDPQPEPRASNSTPASPSQRASDSTRASGSSRRSVDTAPTTDSRTSTSTLSMPIIDLERRLSTERTLDIFTMQSKQVRLQIAPPNLHYTRELRCSTSVVMSFVPRATGVEVVQERGHIFLLTDLMLVCEKMTPEEMEVAGRDGPDMWLLYPPLAGKHLRVAPVDDVSLSVTILRKETLIMQTDSKASRDRLISDFKECIETASSLFPPSSKNPPPPVPALPSMASNGGNVSRPPSVPLDRSHPPSMVDTPPGRFSGSLSPARVTSPISPGARQSADSSVSSRVNSAAAAALADAALSGGLGGLNIGGPVSPQSPPMGAPPHAFPPRSSSTAPGPFIPSQGFGPGQVMPPQQFGPPPSSFGPGQLGPGHRMPPQHMGGPPGPMGGPPGPIGGPPGHVGGPHGGPPGHMGGPPGAPGRGPPPGSYMPPPGPGGPMQRNPSFGHGPAPNGIPPGPPHGPFEVGMPLSRQQNMMNGPPPGHGPLPPGHPGFNGMPSSLQSNFTSGPPQVGQSYQGMQPQPRPPQLAMGNLPPRGQGGPSPVYPPPRPPSEPFNGNGDLRKMPSTRSFTMNAPPHGAPRPPMYGHPNDLPPPQPGFFTQRNGSSSSLPNMTINTSRTLLPSEMSSASNFSVNDIEEPDSPVAEEAPEVPTTSVVSAKMKCKLFLKQQHAQWKSLGTGQLMLYRQNPTNIKQLVVEKDKNVLISTIVLTDGVERVGKTGVAIELSDKGLRTGVVYMLQLRNEKSAVGLFDELLFGSDRAGRG